MTRFAFASLLVLFATTSAAAEVPTGFTEFAWGTNPTVLREQFVTKRCRSSTESRRTLYSVQCHGYFIEGLSTASVQFYFEPADALSGYHMIVARGSYRAFRDLVTKRFGPPTTRSSILWSGQQMSWVWSGVSATLLERCGEESSCLEVTTTALDKRREQIRERERRESAQSF